MQFNIKFSFYINQAEYVIISIVWMYVKETLLESEIYK